MPGCGHGRVVRTPFAVEADAVLPDGLQLGTASRHLDIVSTAGQQCGYCSADGPGSNDPHSHTEILLG